MHQILCYLVKYCKKIVTMSLKSWARHNSTDTGATETDFESGKDEPIRGQQRGVLTNQRTAERCSDQSEDSWERLWPIRSVCMYMEWAKWKLKLNYISRKRKWGRLARQMNFWLKNALKRHGLRKLLTIFYKQYSTFFFLFCTKCLSV